MKKTILALCLAIFPLMGLSETQRIDTVGGVLGIYKDPGQYGNAPVLFLGSIKNKILEDDRIQIDDRKKLGKDKELFLVSTNCNGSGCRVESHYLIMISKSRKWKILAGPIETNGDVTLQERGKTLRLQYELYEGARVFQVTRTISQDGKISKEERKIISEPDFEVKDFSDLQRGDRLLGAAIHYGPVEQELKILGVFDKVAKHLDQYGSGFVLSPNGGDCVEFFADGTNVYGMETLVVKVWKNGKFFILMEPKQFSDKFEIYSNLEPRELDLTLDSLRFSDFETGFCKVNTGEFRLCAYSKFVVDFIQKTCKADVVNTDRASNFLSFLRGIENGRMPKLSIRDDIYLNRGIGRLAQQKNLSSDEYQILLFRNFTTGCQKGVGVAVKLILICGEKPDCSLTSDELRRFRLLKDVGEDGFARHFVSASERATNKAMTIKPMALLELNQKDLREMWRCLSGE